MQNIRQILFSQTEPEFKEVGWLTVEDDNLVLKFYGNGTWSTIASGSVVDNLNSLSTKDSLSANQGNVLKGIMNSIPGFLEYSNVTTSNLRFEPSDGHLYLDYLYDPLYSVDERGHLILTQ